MPLSRYHLCILTCRCLQTVEELVPDERIADKRKKYARVNTLKCQTADAIRELGKVRGLPST